MKEDTITIICDDEDCREKYILSMDTLRTVGTIEIRCRNCGNIQRISIKEGGIEIIYVK